MGTERLSNISLRLEPIATQEILENRILDKVTEIGSRYPKFKEISQEFKSEVFEILGKKEEQNLETITFDNKSNSKFKIGKENLPLTKGGLISALESGIEYSLDQETFETNSLSKKIYDDYMLARAEYYALKILNRHILIKEKCSDMAAYSGLEAAANSKIENLSKGMLAEKIVFAYLKKLSIDSGELRFEVIGANFYEDVKKKIDFTIRLKKKVSETGVRVDTEEDSSVKRIQFTIGSTLEMLKKKRRGC